MQVGDDLFRAVGIHDPGAVIDWELRPEDTFGTFESWGGRERLRHNGERFYYFFIDGWADPPCVCLMERAVKHARVLARITAPQALVQAAIHNQGRKITLDRSYAIDAALAAWLRAHLIERFDPALVTVRREPQAQDMTDRDLAPVAPPAEPACLPCAPQELDDAAAHDLIRSWNFYDRLLNPEGNFANAFVLQADGLTVLDLATGVEWQRRGLAAITSVIGAQRYAKEMNQQAFAGHSDWRLPSLAEALSLLAPRANRFGYQTHSCLSTRQPYIFTNQARRPGGRWFVDLQNGNAFWASAFNPGGYARLCRSSSGKAAASP